MHFDKIPDEPVETTTFCQLSTDAPETHGRESSSEVSSEDNSSDDSEDERVQRLAKLQEQVVD
jgi:bromodomain testis-specific protein